MSLIVPAGWSELSLSNDRPMTRGGRASCISGDGTLMLLYGGCDPFGIASNELHLVSLLTGRAEAATAQQQQGCPPPQGRSGACLVCLPSPSSSSSSSNLGTATATEIRVVMFGGARFLPSETVFSDVWLGVVRPCGAFRGGEGRVSTVVWTQIEIAEPESNNNNDSNGTFPARHSFASCLVAGGAGGSDATFLFVYGGSGAESRLLAEPMLLNLSPLLFMNDKQDSNDATSESSRNTASTSKVKLAWSRLPVAAMADPLPPCEMCTACFSPALSTVFFGGGRSAACVSQLFFWTLPSSSSALSPICRLGRCPAFERICASLAPIFEQEEEGGGKSVTLALIGGVSEDAIISAFPLDVAIDVSASSSDSSKLPQLEMTLVRPIPRLDTTGSSGVSLGIGQVLSSFRVCCSSPASAEYITVVVSGVFPNAVGHTSQVFMSVGKL